MIGVDAFVDRPRHDISHADRSARRALPVYFFSHDTGEPPHVDAVISRLEPLGIVEMVRTGRVAMRRGDTASAAAQYS